jgi:hypothetical protein
VGNRALISGLPEISINSAQVGQARLAGDFAHAAKAEHARLPTLIWGLWSQASIGLSFVAEARRARRRAEPCVAQRAAAVDERWDWLPAIYAADHCITSYPVGSR